MLYGVPRHFYVAATVCVTFTLYVHCVNTTFTYSLRQWRSQSGGLGVQTPPLIEKCQKIPQDKILENTQS